MSAIDKDLAEALAESEAEAVEAEGVARPAPPEPPERSRRNLGLLLALLVMAGGILALVMTSFEDAAVYSKDVDALLRERAALSGRNVRVQGTLVKGSLKYRDDPCEYRFRMQKNDAVLEVRYAQCVVPDTFRDVPGMDVDVTAVGTLSGEHFAAEQIMAKCPSKYDMKQRAAGGEKAPHAALAATSVPAESPY
jgi:cytochrome c-type biogenesis protein CcmE